MDSVLSISQIIFFISLSILCIYLIKYFKKITESIVSIEFELKDLKKQAEPVLKNIEILSTNVNNTITSINSQIDTFSSSIDNFKEISNDVLEFERKIKQTIEKPVNDILNIITGALSGIKFVSSLFGRSK